MNVSAMTFPSETLPAAQGSPPALPGWVAELASAGDADRRMCLRSMTVAAADEMDDQTLEAAVAESYSPEFSSIFTRRCAMASGAILEFSAGAASQESQRVAIGIMFSTPADSTLSSGKYGGRSQFAETVATASAVGSSDHDLVIHCLSRRNPGVPIDNPSQVRPYQYSQRYGQRPPCFARGTLIDGTTLLVGGTASIVGEESLHGDDLIAQAQQTLANLSSLVMAADLSGERPLDAFRSLRVYHPRREDRDPLSRLLKRSVSES